MSRTLRSLIILIAPLGCAHPASRPQPPRPTVRQAASRPDSTSAPPRRSVAKLLMGDAVIAAYARRDGRVEVATSAPDGSLVLDFLPADVDQWAAITARILKSRATARRGRSAVDRSTLAEPGVVAGALTLSRRVHGRSVVYELFFADRHFGGFPVRITRRDASVLVGTLRRAAAMAQAMRPAISDSAASPDSTRDRPRHRRGR